MVSRDPRAAHCGASRLTVNSVGGDPSPELDFSNYFASAPAVLRLLFHSWQVRIPHGSVMPLRLIRNKHHEFGGVSKCSAYAPIPLSEPDSSYHATSRSGEEETGSPKKNSTVVEDEDILGGTGPYTTPALDSLRVEGRTLDGGSGEVVVGTPYATGSAPCTLVLLLL